MGEKQQEAFGHLKTTLFSLSVLKTNASHQRQVGVLNLVQQGKEKVITIGSRRLKLREKTDHTAQKKYSQHTYQLVCK